MCRLALRRRVEAAEKALELNSQLAKAHAVLGLIQFAYDWKWSAAEASLKRAIELDSNEARALTTACGLARTLGRDDAVKLCEQAVARIL